MSDTAPEPTVTAPGAPAPAPAPDNAVIRQMRAELDAKNAEIRKFHEEKQEAERSRMDEIERLKLEKKELEAKVVEDEKLRNEVGQYQSKFQSLYETALAAAPEDKRPALEDLTSNGSWPDRYEQLMKAKALVGIIQPAVAGTPTEPAAVVRPANVAAPFDPKNPPAWPFKD